MLKIKKKNLKKYFKLLLFFLITLSCFLLYIKAENDTKSIEIKNIPIIYNQLPEELNGYKIGFISDIHLGPSTHKNFMQKIIKKINKENLDLLILGGDYIWYEETRLFMLKRNNNYSMRPHKKSIRKIYYDVASNISKAKTKNGIFLVMGNHDNWIYPNLLKQEVKKFKNLNLYSNNIKFIKRKNTTISIFLFEDYWHQSPYIKNENIPLQENEFRILVAHNPDSIIYLSDSLKVPFHLSLSGHTHGGQIRAPFLPFITNTYFEKLNIGLEKISLGYHYTSAGIGMTSIPFRFNTRPEIVILTLQNNKKI